MFGLFENKENQVKKAQAIRFLIFEMTSADGHYSLENATPAAKTLIDKTVANYSGDLPDATAIVAECMLILTMNSNESIKEAEEREDWAEYKLAHYRKQWTLSHFNEYLQLAEKNASDPVTKNLVEMMKMTDPETGMPK